jgi:hypothetical protein
MTNVINAGGRQRESQQCTGSPRENPFASRYVRPGALPFLFSDGSEVADLLERLRSYNWWGSIIGPHGSGKSTLLARLEEALRQRGCEVTSVVAGQPPATALRSLAADGRRRPRLLLLDGYDLLPGWKRWWIRRLCRRADVGLLVTCHRVAVLPVLRVTTTSVSLALRLAGMLSGAEFAAQYDRLIRESFARHGGNLREVWFDLYDRYERCNRPADGRV